MKTIPGSKQRFGNHLNLWLEFMSLRGLPMYKETIPIQINSILPERRYALGSYLDHHKTIPKKSSLQNHKLEVENQISKNNNRLKPLLKPKPIQLQVNSFGNPSEHITKGTSAQSLQSVEAPRKSFWWEDQIIDRQYYRLLLQDGFEIDVFQDLNDKCWYQQRFH